MNLNDRGLADTQRFMIERWKHTVDDGCRRGIQSEADRGPTGKRSPAYRSRIKMVPLYHSYTYATSNPLADDVRVLVEREGGNTSTTGNVALRIMLPQPHFNLLQVFNLNFGKKLPEFHITLQVLILQ